MDHQLTCLEFGSRRVVLMGVACTSQEAVECVRRTIRARRPQCVCVEVDDARAQDLLGMRQWQEYDLARVLREGKGFFLLSTLALSAFQKRLSSGTGVRLGDEVKAAIEVAAELSAQVAYIDRSIEVTLRRAWRVLNPWGRAKLLAVLLSVAFTGEQLSEQRVAVLCAHGAMDGLMQEIISFLPAVKGVLVDDRNQYLASKIWAVDSQVVMAVVSAGSVAGVQRCLYEFACGARTAEVTNLETVGSSPHAGQLLGWLFPLLLMGVVVTCFFAGGVGASRDALMQWLWWSGSMTALGVLCALGHPLSIVVGFVGAPIAVLTPIIGVGLFTGFAQAWVCRPQVADMERLADDIVTFRGWYRNKFAHVLLVVVLSSIGAMIGSLISVPMLLMNLFR